MQWQEGGGSHVSELRGRVLKAVSLSTRTWKSTLHPGADAQTMLTWLALQFLGYKRPMKRVTANP